MAWIVYYLTILLTSRFTFKSDGFYKTLQRKAAKILKETGTGPDWSSSIFQDFLTLSFLICFQCCSLLFPHVCRGGQQGRGQDGGRGEVQGEVGFEEY